MEPVEHLSGSSINFAGAVVNCAVLFFRCRSGCSDILVSFNSTSDFEVSENFLIFYLELWVATVLFLLGFIDF